VTDAQTADPVLHSEPLTADAFAPWGDVLEAAGAPDKLINEGMCGRYHNRARLDIIDGQQPSEAGQAGISLFQAKLRALPFRLTMVERHPLGSQAFLPMSESRFLVVVADDRDGVPVNFRAFLTRPGQGVNLGRNVWHGVLCPLDGSGLFAVIDRVGEGVNLEEHWLDQPILIPE